MNNDFTADNQPHSQEMSMNLLMFKQNFQKSIKAQIHKLKNKNTTVL